MKAILRYIGIGPVADIFVMLLTLSPLLRNNALYVQSARSRWAFHCALNQFNIVQKLCDIAMNSTSKCFINNNLTCHDHSSAAINALYDVVEKLSTEECGDLVLPTLCQPHSLSRFIDLAADITAGDLTRLGCLKLLCFLLRRSGEEEVVACSNGLVGASPIPPAPVQNRLFPLRKQILSALLPRTGIILKSLLVSDKPIAPPPPSFSSTTTNETSSVTNALTDLDINKEGNQEVMNKNQTDEISVVVKHPGHIVMIPFSSVRLTMVEYLVLLIEGEEGQASAEMVSPDLWAVLLKWVKDYPHNNMYHSLLYRALYVIIRFVIKNSLIQYIG